MTHLRMQEAHRRQASRPRLPDPREAGAVPESAEPLGWKTHRPRTWDEKKGGYAPRGNQP